jgi:hypothetical protein
MWEWNETVKPSEVIVFPFLNWKRMEYGAGIVSRPELQELIRGIKK